MPLNCKWYAQLSMQQGSTALMALVTMGLIGVISAGCFVLAMTEYRTALDYRDGIVAHYLAESGMQHAMVRLKYDEAFRESSAVNRVTERNTLFEQQALDGLGTYQAVVTGAGASRTLVTVGSAAAAKRQLVVEATLAERIGDTQWTLIIHSWKIQN